MSAQFIYITCKDRAEAQSVGTHLLEDRLVACVNIIDGMQSMYWWEGQIQSSNEAILIAKTRQARVEAIINKVNQVHSYDCPCVVSLPVGDGNPKFLEWILEETQFQGRKTDKT